MTKVVIDRYTYAWHGDEELCPGDLVLLPENWWSRMDKGPGPFIGIVDKIGSDYEGELSHIICKLPEHPEERP